MARPKSEDKKQALLEAATAAFAQSGIAASTSAIARSAGVAEGTLFRYFATKDELLNELYLAIKLRLVRTMIAGLDPDEKRPKENARNIWNSYIDWGVRNPMEHKAIRRMALSERITDETRRQVKESFPELNEMCQLSVKEIFLSEAYRAFGDALFLSLAETRRETPSRIDWQGTLYLALILCCLLFPMALGPELHWPLWLQLMLVAVLPLLFAMRQSALRQQQRGDHPLLPPRLLQLTSIRFGMAIALLFFSAWSGFMFCMALTMQEGLGMAPWQSGNSFIALGVAYFISALYAPRLIARYSMGRILLTGLAVQIAGLLLLCATFSRFGVATSALTLVPATALIGYGQALIVNSFYRIGMRDISASDAGAGSAILSTLQQATLGLGPAILGSLFLALARRGGGNYPQALIDFLLVEVAMMLLLGAIALWLRHHLNRQPATVAS